MKVVKTFFVRNTDKKGKIFNNKMRSKPITESPITLLLQNLTKKKKIVITKKFWGLLKNISVHFYP